MNMKQVESKRSTMYEDEKEMLFNNLKWLTTKEAANYLRKSEAGFRAFIHRYDVPKQYLGAELRFRREDLDKLLSVSPTKKERTE